jgi:WD40 repeat protein
MRGEDTGFFIVGGTLPGGALSYIVRSADDALCDALTRGEFCAVLTSRQMGKSSLMVHAAQTLARRAVQSVIVDFTTIGSAPTLDRWIDAVCRRIALLLDLSDEHAAFIASAREYGPAERIVEFLRTVVLPACPDRLVLFLDEIDYVRQLPFDASEFFVAIRACCNDRSMNAAFQRLAVCLLGVASPASLVADRTITPYNIGTLIHLSDFTPSEAELLAVGLIEPESDARAELALPAGPADGRAAERAHLALQRVLWWTGGQPYLTQKLCQALAELGRELTNEEIDRTCEQILLARAVRDDESNLAFVANTLLLAPDPRGTRTPGDGGRASGSETPGEAVVAERLALYRKVLLGRTVPDDDKNPAIGCLKLAGIVRSDGCRLQVRNRVYARVFDRAWIAENMPRSQRKLQRRAYWRGVTRAALVTAVLAGLIVSMGALVYRERVNADLQRELRNQARSFNYAADMYVAGQGWERGGDRRALDLLVRQRPMPGENDLRGWEWRYLWGQFHQNRTAVRDGNSIVFSTAYSRDGRLLATGSGDKLVRLWDARTGALLAAMPGHTNNVLSVAFSPDGRLLASCGDDDTLRLWDTRTHGQVGRAMVGHFCVAFSPDGSKLAAATAEPEHAVGIWSVATQRQVDVLPHSAIVRALAFSPDGKLLAAGGAERRAGVQPSLVAVRIWNVGTHDSRSLYGHVASIYSLAFSPNGRLLASGSEDRTVKIWEVASRKPIATLAEHTDLVNSVAFSPDGRTLASGSWDMTTRLWNTTTWKPIRALRGQPDRVTSVAFSPDGKSIVTASQPEVRIWDATPPPPDPATVFRSPAGLHTALSPDGSVAAVWDEWGKMTWWDVRSGKRLPSSPVREPELESAGRNVTAAAFSPDGTIFGAAAGSGRVYNVSVWNVLSRAVVGSCRCDNQVFALAFSSSNALLAIGDDDGRVTTFDIRSQRTLASWNAHRNGVYALAFSPQGDQLVTGGWDRTINAWDIQRGKPGASPAISFQADTFVGNSIAFSPDGMTLATANNTDTVTLWQVPTFREMISLHADRPIRCVWFSPDRQTLYGAGGDKDGAIVAWRAPDWPEINGRE